MSTTAARTILCGALAACGAIKPLPANQFAPAAPAPAAAPVAADGGPPGEPLPMGPVLENTFAADDRQVVGSDQAPWSTVGRLSNGCTATLIDRQLVLTAAHCVFDEEGRWTADHFTFSP